MDKENKYEKIVKEAEELFDFYKTGSNDLIFDDYAYLEQIENNNNITTSITLNTL